MFSQAEARPHWNLFIALEADLLVIARYVEPATANLSTYSIELARLLFAAASEIDVLLKVICRRLSNGSKAGSIDKYREIVRPAFPFLETARVVLPRYGLDSVPWLNWQENNTPEWWLAYNRVKHRRDEHFQDASLQNALNALGGLFLVLLVNYGSLDRDAKLVPVPSLFEVDEEVAQVHHTTNGKTILHFGASSWNHA